MALSRRFSSGLIRRLASRTHQQWMHKSGKYIDQEDANDEFHVLPMGDSDIGQASRVTMISKEMEEEGLVFIKHLSSAGFRLANDNFLMGPIAAFPKTVLSWRVPTPEQITPDALSLFFMLQPKLDVLIIGAGDKKDVDLVRKNIAPAISKQRIGYEIVETEEAIPIFNFLNNEHRYVAAGLYPPREIVVTAADFANVVNEYVGDRIDNESRTFGIFSFLDTDFGWESDDHEIRSICYRIWGIRSPHAEEMIKRILQLREEKDEKRFERLEAKIKKDRKEHFLEVKRRSEEAEKLQGAASINKKIGQGEKSNNKNDEKKHDKDEDEKKK